MGTNLDFRGIFQQLPWALTPPPRGVSGPLSLTHTHTSSPSQSTVSPSLSSRETNARFRRFSHESSIAVPLVVVFSVLKRNPFSNSSAPCQEGKAFSFLFFFCIQSWRRRRTTRARWGKQISNTLVAHCTEYSPRSTVLYCTLLYYTIVYVIYDQY